jgi:antitoxin (DNA-binding transcriptional repressor) of toxin-antitoxin stability system
MYTIIMKALTVTEFRRSCLTLLANLPEGGVVITKRGQPLARVTPLSSHGKGKRVTLPLLKGKGKPGPLSPNLETPYDLVFD